MEERAAVADVPGKWYLGISGCKINALIHEFGVATIWSFKVLKPFFVMMC